MAQKYASLFQPLNIGKVKIKNRIGMAPMSVFGLVSADGCFTQRCIDYYVERAKGGTGLIITGYSEVENDVEISLNGIVQNTSLNPPRFISTAGEMTERIHAYGTKIFLQITLGLGRSGYAPWINCQPIAPSPIPNFWNPKETCRELSISEIEFLIQKTVEGAKIAKQSGFDGIEIHAAHEGYLLDQFTLSIFNQRLDKYGGSLRNRLALATEIVQEIKRQVGQDFPVILRYSIKSFLKDWNQGGLLGEEFIEKGRDVEEGLEAALIFEEAGYDALNTDCGTYEGFYWAHPPSYLEHGCYLPYVEKLKATVKIPILMAGRMEIPDLAEEAVSEEKIDMVMLGRGLLAEPAWANKVRKNKIPEIRPCLGCHDGCLGRQDLCRPMSCAVNPACGRETIYALTPALKPKQIIIAGGGVAGMEAARVSAMRGHQVTLFEKTAALGGHLIEASVPSFKEDLRKLIKWYQKELDNLKVTVHLGKEVTSELLHRKQGEVVIIATGSKPGIPLIPGINGNSVSTADQALLGKKAIGERILIIGGGLMGCELALWLKEQGKDITIVELTDELMSRGDVPFANKQMLMDLLKFHQVKIITNSTVTLIENKAVTIINKDFRQKTLEFDNIIIATGYQKDNNLYEDMTNDPWDTYLIGDARGARNIMAAIWEAYEIARSI